MSMQPDVPQKFMFDLDLGQVNEKPRVISETELTNLLRQAQETGFAKGVTEGENSAANKAAAALSAATQDLANRTAKIARTADDMQKQTLVDATNLGVSVGRKLAANLIARSPLGEIRTLISECLTSLENAPHLVIRCHPDLADAIEKDATAQMHTSGFSGRLVIMGEPDIMLGDARLEWVDGGLVRDLSKISDEIDQRVNAFIKGKSPEPAPQNTQDTTEIEQ